MVTEPSRNPSLGSLASDNRSPCIVPGLPPYHSPQMKALVAQAVSVLPLLG